MYITAAILQLRVHANNVLTLNEAVHVHLWGLAEFAEEPFTICHAKKLPKESLI